MRGEVYVPRAGIGNGWIRTLGFCPMSVVAVGGSCCRRRRRCCRCCRRIEFVAVAAVTVFIVWGGRWRQRYFQK